MAEQELDYQAIAIVLHDSKNQSLHGTLNFTVWRQAEEEEEYDQEGAAYYVVAVILVYGLSMVLLIGSLAKKKMGDKGQEMEENQLHRFLEQMPDLREQSARDNYRQLKSDIRALVNKDSNATTTSSVGSPPTSPPPPGAPGSKKAVSFKEGELLAKDSSGKLIVSSQIPQEADEDREKEYLLSVGKSGFSDDSASSLLDQSNNSTTGLLRDRKDSTGDALPKDKYDCLNDWPVDNPSDIWVSYEPESTSPTAKSVDDKIPLGYSPGRPHKSYPNPASMPNSPSPSIGRREFPQSASQPTSPEKPSTLRTYFEPLKPDPQQFPAYTPPHGRPRSYVPPVPIPAQSYAPYPHPIGLIPQPQAPQAQVYPQLLPPPPLPKNSSYLQAPANLSPLAHRRSWSPGQPPEIPFPGRNPFLKSPPSPKFKQPPTAPSRPFQPPSPNARRLAQSGSPVLQHRPLQRLGSPSPPPQAAMMDRSPRNSIDEERRPSRSHSPRNTLDPSSRRERSPSPRNSGSPNSFVDGLHVTADIAQAVRNMADPAKSLNSSKDDLMQVTCL